MKKYIALSVLFLFCCVNIFAQGSASLANRNTAQRCLKLAENCQLSGDWEDALRQAELGLTYDDSISDLIYIKAAAQYNLGARKADALDVISQAFNKDNWIGYSKNGARILYSDILCDTGHYSESLEVLNDEPFIYSADAEFIRIKNYYRMGTADSLKNARQKVNSARRVYPSDIRFPELFFIFETTFKNEAEVKGVDYTIPENVQIIADSYISKLPDYSGNNEELEVYASFLANEEINSRLIKSISAKTKTKNPLLVIQQLKIGMISEDQAFDDFFEFINDSVNLNTLELFVKAVQSEEVKYKIVEKLTNYEGFILIDDDLDLQNELSVKYSLGRPQYVNYDKNYDGIKEMYVACDYGAPVSVHFTNDNIQLFYDTFPNVQKVQFLNDNYTFNFLHDDYVYAPFEMRLNTVLQEIGLSFYVPFINSEITVPNAYELLIKSSTVELPITERDNARVVYTTLNGKLVFAHFYENEKEYAFCDFSTGTPFVRYADYDNDGLFETSEFFDEMTDDDSLTDEISLKIEQQTAMEKIFSKVVENKNIYLKKVQIDRNSNTFFEFSEEYLENNGSITTWDYDDNGIIDCQCIKYPAKKGESVIEETVFYDSNGLSLVELYSVDGLPLKMNYMDEEVIIYAGDNEHVFFIDERLSLEVELAALEFANKGISQGTIDLMEYEEERYSIIKIGKDIFCKKIIK